VSPQPAAQPTLGGITVLGDFAERGETGQAARSLLASLLAAGAPARAVDAADERPLSPLDSHRALIAVVPASRLAAVARRHAALFAASTPVIGYWWSDLPTAGPGAAEALPIVDRVWVPTAFAAQAYRPLATTSVELQPLYLPEPESVTRTLSSFGVDAGYVFLTVFDHSQGIERINPLGVIQAFTEAFAPTADVGLLIKSDNADLHPDAHARLLAAAAGDDRIHVLEAYIDATDRAALLGGADCVVALHRSDGLPLHLAEAMWLHTPVIASRFGGNVDWMDDSCAALVDVRLTAATGDDVPEGTEWADPDVDLAADWMRRLAIDPALSARLASAAARRVAAQPSSAAVGERLVAALGRASPPPATPSGMLRTLARRASSPVRDYINSHFEMTKQEVRALRTGIGVTAAALPNEAVHRQLTEVADLAAELGVHHARGLADVRAEMAGIRAELAELRADLGTLTEALIRIIEDDDLPRHGGGAAATDSRTADSRTADSRTSVE
jgi:Glycosyl transferases group 1